MYFCLLMKKILFAALLLFTASSLLKAQGTVPHVYSNIYADGKGRLNIKDSTGNYYLQTNTPRYTLEQLKGNPKADDKGISFYFGEDFPIGNCSQESHAAF